jgi:translation initiation factor IF-2
MNNSKVRIYDLSKELNLENKDLLDICDQLNIAVKSHSSTITEEQAERIKATAAKLPRNPSLNKPSPPQNEAVERKQEILAYHHTKRTEENYLQPQTAAGLKLVSPPRPPSKTDLNTTPPLATEFPSIPERPTVQPPVVSSPQKKPLTPQTSNGDKPVTTTNPPQRPTLKSPETQVSKVAPPNLVEKPIVKVKGETPTPGGRPSSENREKKNLRPPGKPETGERRGKAVPSEAPKPLVELKRPSRPQKSAAPEETEIPATATLLLDEDGDDDLLVVAPGDEKQKPKLKRPTAVPRKRADWEEEEDDKEENKNKTAKLAKTSKGKKKTQLLFEEDEDDFDPDREQSAEAMSFSLATARPPKPKSLLKSAPIMPAELSKPKKSTRSEGSSSRSKADRKEAPEEVPRPEKIMVEGSLTVRELAEVMKVSETEIIKMLFFKGMAVNITQTLDFDTIEMVAREFEIAVETETQTAAATKTTEMLSVDDLENLQLRPPVVTIMGHVDHGKTTLLDSIRKTKVAQGEAGGITQHIGAYHVDVEHNGKNQQIVFLDTPGHEAFTAMRARGARVTDIAILVVAADDGVQPQTREAVSHAKAAAVPIVVAINKIDKPEANPDRIKQELSELGLVPEEWGGETIMVPVSALKGENLDGLLEMILLVSEMEELSANPDRPAKGTVIEANLDRTRGPVATLLVQNGTLQVGDTLVAGSVLGKIRAMIDDRGEKVEAATPSFAVEVLGLNDVPAAGDEFSVYKSEKEARQVAEERAEASRQTRLQQALSSRRVSLSTLSAQAQEGQLKELNLLVKADVQGSAEAILSSLQQLPQREVQIRVLLCAPGEVTETDVDLAAASGAVIVGFNTTLASGARAAADREGVDVREYNIIYKLLDDIQGAMEGLLDPEEIEEALGSAEVRAVFPVGRGTVAGCYVQSGKLVRNRLMRIVRSGEVIFDGVMDSLKRMKEDAKEVNAGYECGVGSNKFNAWQEGDIIQAYERSLKRRTLSLI